MTQTETQPTAGSSTDTLMSEYVSVINRAIDKHAESFPFKQILAGFQRLMDNGERIGVAVYSTTPESPHDYFTLRYNAAGRFEMAARGKQEPTIEWKVKRTYLEEVARNQSKYIDDPIKLDWDWVKTRMKDALS